MEKVQRNDFAMYIGLDFFPKIKHKDEIIDFYNFIADKIEKNSCLL